MKIFTYISIILTLIMSHNLTRASMTWEEIKIEAGKDQNLCEGEHVILSTLGAHIMGLVSDGNWFSNGDGQFVPNNRFTTAQKYIPGPQDIRNGKFSLTLVSDDPDGAGPKVQVNDVVNFTFISAPPLLCNTDLTIPLNEQCEMKILAVHVLFNPLPPYDKYSIVLRDEKGNVIKDGIVTIEHVGQTISYTVKHDCSQITCSGKVTIIDNVPPSLLCRDTTLSCYTKDFGPDSLGFPLPIHAVLTRVDSTTFVADSVDACGQVRLQYADEKVNFDCNNNVSKPIISRISRTWTATDVNGNKSTCLQKINIYAAGIDTIVFPPNYDNVDSMALSSDDEWPKLQNGLPSPDTTGAPVVRACTNINVRYTDTKVPTCGAGYRVLRKWHIIDWCTNQDKTHNQVIKVEDREGPKFTCQDSLKMQADPYTCTINNLKIPEPTNVVDVSSWTYTIHLYDKRNKDITAKYIVNNHVRNIPIGVYRLEYQVKDACGNITICSVPMEVIDRHAPVVNCKSYVTTSINEEGTSVVYASSIDNGSTDNCGEIKLEVARQDALVFGKYVRFTCADVGKSIMVTLRVTDASGNTNICMVEVKVEDKIKPVLVCPSDITISCNTPWNPKDLSSLGTVTPHNGIIDSIRIDGVGVGVHGYYKDNCGATVTAEDSVFVKCGRGYIYRTFTVRDSFGNKESCKQTITIVNDNPFLESMIQWPKDTTMYGCDSLDARIAVTGVPILGSSSCGQPQFSYEDQVFDVVEGACKKIVRSWTVIDWCTYDTDRTRGIWRYTQVIKLTSNKAPTISTCKDTVLCSYSNNCQKGVVRLSIDALDDCTPADKIRYSWSIDIDNNGSYDKHGQGKSLAEELAYGTHKIIWKAEDGCGNSTSCEQLVTSRNCKKPTPYCVAKVSTAIMPSSKKLTIYAKSFNLDSWDNCTPKEELKYSFSKDVSNSSRVITCADIPNGISADIKLDMWVTDGHGEQDYCSVILHIEDTNDVCADDPNYMGVVGSISTPSGTMIDSVPVAISSDGEHNYTVTTDSSGIYRFGAMSNQHNYSIMPKVESKTSLGVNVRDLLTIQRHLLKLDTLKTVYDTLAADVNNDGYISPLDLLHVRKAILFSDFSFKAGNGTWRFVDKDADYSQYQKKFDVEAGIIIKKGESRSKYDIVAIKLGDVNGSVDGSLSQIKRRFTKTLPIDVVPTDEGYALYLPKSVDIEAFQIGLVSTHTVDVISQQVDDQDMMIDGNSLRMLHYNGTYDHSQPLCHIRTYGQISLDSRSMESQIYNAEDGYDVELRMVKLGSHSLGVHPNPFIRTIHIDIASEDKEDAQIHIYNTHGKLVYTDSAWKGGVLDLSRLSSGLYVLRYTISGGEVLQRKIVKVD